MHLNTQTSTNMLSPGDIQIILSLRLLIARAANTDSLAWWEDDALTPAADFVLARLFPMAPGLAGRSLALQAALTRHNAACPPGALHLYRLDADNRDRLALRGAHIGSVPLAAAPLTDMDALRDALATLTDGPCPYTVVREGQNRRLLIELPPAPRGITPMVHRAGTLAWAYLGGAPGAPVFPYCLEAIP